MIIIADNRPQSVKKLKAFVDEKTDVQADFTAIAGQKGATVSSVDWSVDSGSATLGTPTLSSSISTCEVVSPSSDDISLIKIVGTLSTGKVISKYLQVNTQDPSC